MMKKNLVYFISIVVILSYSKYNSIKQTDEIIRLKNVVAELKYMLDKSNINFQSRFEEINNESRIIQK